MEEEELIRQAEMDAEASKKNLLQKLWEIMKSVARYFSNLKKK